MNNQQYNIDPQDIRTEYSALSSYHSSVVKYRFTTLGFYLAAVGFIVSGSNTIDKAFLLFGISIALYILELRNRSLYSELAERGMEIERLYWGYVSDIAYKPFYSRMIKTKPDNEIDPDAGLPPPLSYPKIWNWKIKFAASHTKALDLLYGVITLYSLVQIIRNLI